MVNYLSRNSSKGKELRVTSDLATYGLSYMAVPIFLFLFSFGDFILDHFV